MRLAETTGRKEMIVDNVWRAGNTNDLGGGHPVHQSRPRDIRCLRTTCANLDGKQLELLKQVVPKLSHVAFLHNRANSSSDGS